ncbi:hypothetical protein [Steroidobacter agaridevorans]|uniref:hypothetical protein n=1 Tax=Steroidobacter agaridevorans TaxID=2695856 RepID=UPI001325BB17|nr:hypothetical protein [Steroidobacter agaridevorans]GFE88425.1 hypothetical protein GCM10011488_33790 [Steroidobacter agaridevorans]
MRPSVIVASIGMLAVCGGLVYMQTTRDESETAASAATTQPSRTEQAIAPTPDQAATTTATASSSVVTDTTVATAPPSPETVDQWIKDTQGSDPKIRAAAIANLANAPTAQALPALSEVIDAGEPEVDRHIALRSLHALALRDGDENGQVRDVMRRAIYHSDNDGVTQTAQSLLDDVEAAFAERP